MNGLAFLHPVGQQAHSEPAQKKGRPPGQHALSSGAGFPVDPGLADGGRWTLAGHRQGGAEPLRILHLDTERGFRGGERQVQLLAEGLRRRGHESLIAGPGGSELCAVLATDGFSVALWPRPRLLGMRSPLLARWLRARAAEFRADLVHAHTGNAHTAAVAAFAGRLPIVVTRRVDFAVKGNLLSRRKYLAPGQQYLAISSGVRDALLAGGVPPARIALVPSGVEASRVLGGSGAALRAEWLGPDKGPLVGFVGALVDHKAPWILAQAAPLLRRRLPGARVVFVGEGECRPRLEALRVACPEAIVLAGWRRDVADCYAAFDLFAMPSKLEGLCTALVDALVAGVPAVASRAGGIPDVVRDGETGVLVPPEDPQALADALAGLWSDEARRLRFIEAGRRHAAEHFTADAMVEGTLRGYAAALG